MQIRDILVANLKLAVHRCGGIPALAAKCDAGSIKYFEQIIGGFQGPKDKHPRSPGAKVSASVAAAIGQPAQWMYEKHEDEWKAIAALPKTADISPAARQVSEKDPVEYVPKKTQRDRDIDELLAITERISERGLAALLFSARQVAEQFPLAKQTPKSSA